MTRFEEVGVNHQYEANNIKDAIRAFKYSCDCCCSKGMHLDCPSMQYCFCSRFNTYAT